MSKKSFFKSSEILHRSGRVPFSDRNGKLHRSNPHIHFTGGGGELKLSETNSGGGGLFSSKPSYPSPPKTPSKWKTEISNAANYFPRKWCDFVFRRNSDNKLYRSESFRFIQKTNSLLPPLSAGLDKYRSKKLQVRVLWEIHYYIHIFASGSQTTTFSAPFIHACRKKNRVLYC